MGLTITKKVKFDVNLWDTSTRYSRITENVVY